MRTMASVPITVILLLGFVAHTTAHSKQFQLLRNVLTSSLDAMRREQKDMKNEILMEVNSRIVPHIRQALHQQVLSQIKREVQQSVMGRPANPVNVDITRAAKDEIQREVVERLEVPLMIRMKGELMSNLKKEIKREVKAAVRERPPDPVSVDIRGVKNEIQREVRDRLEGPLRRRLKSELSRSLRGELTRNVKSELAQTLRDELTQTLKDELAQTLKDELAHTLKDELAQTLKDELAHTLKDELAQTLKDELAQTLNEEISRSLKEDIQAEIRNGLARYLRGSLREELSKQISRETKHTVQSSMVGYLKDSLTKEVVKEIQNGGPLKVQTKLTPYQRRLLKKSIMKEVKVEMDKAQKKTDAQQVGKEDMMKEIRKEINRVHQNSPQAIRKDDIMKDIRKEIVKSHKRRDVQQLLKDGIMGDIRKEIQEIHNQDTAMTTEDVASYDRKVKDYVNNITGKIKASSDKLRKDLTAQEKDVQVLTKRVHQLEKKYNNTHKRRHDHTRKNTHYVVTTPSPPPSKVPPINLKERKGKRKEKVEVDQPKKVEFENAREIPPKGSGIEHPNYTKKPGGENDGIYISSRSSTKQYLPDRDSLLIAKQNHSESYFAELSSGRVSTLSTSLGKYVGDVSYDVIGKTLYWSDWRVDAIYSYSVVDEEQVILKPGILTYGVEVDTRGRVIVCSDYWSRTLFTMDIDMGGDSSRSMRQITKISEGNPMRIALDIASKKIYVSVSYTKILQVNYDNGRKRTIVEIQRGFINGLGINPKTRILYFNNFTSLMGKNVTRRRQDPFRVSHRPGMEPSDILVHNGDVYIAYYNSEVVNVIRKGQENAVEFAELPYASKQHLRASLCMIPAH